jgi:hypothetical protein
MEKDLYILRDKSRSKTANIIPKKKLLVGSSEACDIVLDYNDINAIHAVLEIDNGSFYLYDMNSTHGTFINSNKVVHQQFKVEDTIQFGSRSFNIEKASPENIVPTVLEMLTPQNIVEVVPPIYEQGNSEDDIPKIVYPLTNDPKAEYSEYIFEDADELYPIFNYQIDKQAVEVIIVYRKKVLSVDYLPFNDGIFNLVGVDPKQDEIEYAYLGKNEKIPFIECSNNEMTLFPLHGYNFFLLGDKASANRDPLDSNPVPLKYDDIVRYSNGDLELFIRGAESPPRIAPAPIFRRGSDLKKYVLLVLLLILSFLAGIQLYEIDEEIEKEKAPERIATILYKRKLVVSKSKAITKTKNKPKIVQKSPKQKPQPKRKVPKTFKKAAANKSPSENQKSGSKAAKKVVVSKKVAPNKGPRDKKSPVVRKQGAKGGSTSNVNSANRKRSRVQNKTKGDVYTFRSKDFKSTLNSLMAKGGTLKVKETSDARNTGGGLNSLASGSDSATLKRAKVSKNIGSLSGASSGSLDASKGTEGLVNKKSIYTVGIPSRTVILGSMDPDIIRKILRDHIPQFRYCYQSALDSSSSAFSGVMVFNFIIGASGHVAKAAVDDADGQVPSAVRGCVLNVLKGIKFPEPLGGGKVSVKQPLNFYDIKN